MKARRIFLLIFIVIVAVAAAYSSSFQGEFILDDHARILNNPGIRSLSATAGRFSIRYLAELSFALDYSLGEFNPAYYHLTNLIIHLLCVLVFFLLVMSLVQQSGRQRVEAEYVAFFSALLWGLHPLATSAVTYICQRYESLMSLFYFSAMYLLAKGASCRGLKGGVFLVLSVLCCLCGIFTKQVIITAPVILLLMDSAFFSGNPVKALRSRWVYYSALSACLLLQVFFIYQRPAHAAMFSAFSADIGIFMYLMNQAKVLTHYFRLALWPNPLSLDYAWQPVLSWTALMPYFLTVGGCFAAVIYGYVKRPKIFFPAVCVFIILSPTSSIIPVPDLAFEHRMYMPLAGLVVFAVAGVTFLFVNRTARSLLAALALVAALALGVKTYMRNRQYSDPEAMWGEITERIPHNFRAWSFYIGEKLVRGDYAGAEISARQMLAKVSQAASSETGVYNIPSSNPQIYEAFGKNLLGRALMGLDRQEEALKEFSEIVQQYPDDAVARQNRAMALLSLGLHSEAESDLDYILQKNPDHLRAGMAKSTLLLRAGRHRDAAALLERILSVYTGFAAAKVDLAWLKSVSYDPYVRDGHRACALISQVEKSLEASSARLFDVEAAANAELGEYDKAVELQKKALNAAAQEYEPSDSRITDMEERLLLYKKRKPFRLRPSVAKPDGN